MNLKNKFRILRKQAGFTLVELIVVIAIIAVLGGVAVPAYSGYIEKANRAADAQLLADVNKAFAAACMMNGENNFFREDIDGTLTNGEFDLVAPPAIDESFNGLYEGGTFKVFSYLKYDDMQGVFLSEEGVLAALKVLLGASSYSNVEITDLTGDVDDLVGMLSDFLATESGQNMLLGSGFADYLETALGIDVNEASEQELSNAAVLYLAKKSADMSNTDFESATAKLGFAIIDFTEGTNFTDSIIDDLAQDTGSTLAGYAMLYATAEAIALAEGTDSAAYQALTAKNPSNPTEVLNVVNDVFDAVDSEKLSGYISDGQYAADMNAYFETLSVVNTKENELKTQLDTENLYTNSETIQNLINQLGG